jgi:hypothetical protein
MDQPYKERVKNLEEITARHELREIEGFNSWRHFVVHQDRGWLMNALNKIQNQVEKVRDAAGEASEESTAEAELNELLSMFEKERLNHLGDEEK